MTSTADISWNDDTYLTRESAAVIQLGLDVNGDAVDQTIKSADGITGTNRNGGDLILASGNSTGNGSSSVIFKAPVLGGGGTTARTAVEIARITGEGMTAGKLIIWGDPTSVPTSPVTGYCYLYVDPSDGGLKVTGTTGIVTTLATI